MTDPMTSSQANNGGCAQSGCHTSGSSTGRITLP
jgi:hypothetical protein